MANEVRLIDANEIPWCHYDLENYHSFVGVDKENVDEVPTIDPESLRPKGRWEKADNLKPKCSVCGEFHLYSWSDYKQCNYCPNCGAKMTDNKGEINK